MHIPLVSNEDIGIPMRMYAQIAEHHAQPVDGQDDALSNLQVQGRPKLDGMTPISAELASKWYSEQLNVLSDVLSLSESRRGKRSES